MRYLIFFIFYLISTNSFAEILTIEDKAKYDITIVSKPKDMQKGLMFVSYLPQNEGMLFDMRLYNDKPISMWMKNTYISLDMLFIDCDYKIVDIHKNAVPHSLDIITSKAKACYVLEINAYEVEDNDLKIGDNIKISAP